MRSSHWSETISGIHGNIPKEQLILTDSFSNVSTAHSNIGYLLTLVLNLSVLLPMQNNQFANNLALCLTNSCKKINIWG